MHYVNCLSASTDTITQFQAPFKQKSIRIIQKFL